MSSHYLCVFFNIKTVYFKLLTLCCKDHAHSPSPSEIPPPPTPEGSLIMSITTPDGSGATQRSSLRTMPSITAATVQRDLVQEFDELIEEVQAYDQSRRQEYEELANEIKATRDEVHGLREFAHRTYSTARNALQRRATLPAILVPRSSPRRPPEVVDRSVGGSTHLSSIFPAERRYIDVAVPPQAASLGQSQSRASSVQSYLSSHHSDDDTLEAAASVAEVSLPSLEKEVDIKSNHDVTISLSASVTSSSRSSDLTSSVLTTSSDLHSSSMFQQPPDPLEPVLQEIRDQIHSLEGGQAINHKLLEEVFERRRDDRAGELTERLERIEGLIQTYIDQGHPRGPEVLQQPQQPQMASITASTNSRLQYLRSILDELTSADVETQLPTSSRTEAAATQLPDETRLPEQISSSRLLEVPRLEHFVYRPKGARARSASPISIERVLPPKLQAVPLLHPAPRRRSRPTRSRRKRKERQESSESEAIRPGTPDVERLLNEQRTLRDTRRQPPPPKVTFDVDQGPTPHRALV